MQHTTVKISVALLGLLAATFSNAATVQASNTVTESLIHPHAKGNLTEFGGASRLKQERSAQLKNSIQATRAKNVILFIGDGTSDSEITIARNYLVGAANYLKGIDILPFTGSYTTYSIDKTGVMNYVTDSAASATAWSTGHKSYNGALGVDVHGKAQATLLELAKKAGMATGNVTTTELQDATPAALYAHISHRKCYAPEATSKKCSQQALENAGAGSITEQLIRTRADITLGGGAASFEELAKAGQYRGKSLLAQAKAEGYTIIRTNRELLALRQANQKQPVLGLFAEGNLPLLWTGPIASQGSNQQAAVSCQNNPQKTAQTPLLKDMTAKAIELLQSNPKGFFLQVESGSIDKANHASNPCGQIGETKQLDDALQVALEFARSHPDTLIILTGDHAHTSQIIPVDAHSPGRTIRLFTPHDQAPMAVNYATETGESQAHTGVQVRIAAVGPRAANVTGLIDQTDLFFIIRDALGLDKAGE